MLESCSIQKKNVVTAGENVKVLGLNFNVAQDSRTFARALLSQVHKDLKTRIDKWSILSNNVLGRKLLANTLLIAKLNYHLPWLSGLRETDFSKLQKTLNGFIFKKRILGLDLKFASPRNGGLGAPYLYNRYVTAQCSWIRKIIKYEDLPLDQMPDQRTKKGTTSTF